MPPPLPYLTMFLRMDQTVGSGAATGHKRPFEDQWREGARAFTLEPPHKRRSNLFVQYGEDRSTQNEQRPAAVPSSQGLQPPQQSLLVIRRPTERPSPQIIKSEAEKITEEPTGPQSPVSVRSDASSSSPSMKPQQRERTSRYLSEGDRRDIISRIDQGEKQVALAKEYQVSRAAICNLYKNREEVMTRANRNPKAKHPKRTKAERTASATGTNKPVTLSPKVSQDVTEDSQSEHGSEEFSSSEFGKDESVADETSSIPEEAVTPREEPRPAQPPPAPVVRLYDASSSSYPIQRMIHVMRNQDLPVASYRRVAQRFIRNFLEEVVACLPRNEMEAPGVDGSVTSALLPLEDENVCGVSIEEQGMSMLQAFTDIFATAQIGFLNVSRCTGIASSSDCWVVQNRMAPMSSSNITVVLDISCTTGNRACTALHHLVSQQGLNPANIYFASLVTTQPAVNRISREFPGVTLVTAAVEENTTDNHTGLSSFLARYWNQRC